MNPLLTIGIPTWNRDQFLKKNLLALIEQVSDQVEILISDNASDDSTQELCQQLASTHSFITYFRQPSNLGANINFETVIRRAKGDYIWLMGDDDLIANHILSKLISDIKQYHPDAIVGPAIFDHSQTKATHQHIQQIICENNHILTNEDCIGLAGKMSGLIFNKKSVLAHLDTAQAIIKQTRTPWPHLAWLILLFNDPDKKLLLLPYGINQIVSANWHNLLFDGKALIKIHFIEYQNLLVALKPLINQGFYANLINRSVYKKQAVLLKCVLYGTYLNSYQDILYFAASFYPKIIGIKNKIYYLIFLLLPLSMPIFLRKWILKLGQVVMFRRWDKFNFTLRRLEKSQKILNSGSLARENYNEQQL